MELLSAKKLESLIKSLNYKDIEAERIKDQSLRKLLMYVHVLGYLETKAINEKEYSNIQNLFYSRYYWFCQFKERYFELYGHDEGLEQQSFKMISDYSQRFPDKIDWNIIEQIESNSTKFN